jgi:hypothetical protein
MKIFIALLASILAVSGVTLKLKPKEEPTIISEKQVASCSQFVIENRVPAKVTLTFSCGADVDAPELDMDPHTRLQVDICDPREYASAPHCFIMTWSRK